MIIVDMTIWYKTPFLLKLCSGRRAVIYIGFKHVTAKEIPVKPNIMKVFVGELVFYFQDQY